MSDSTTNAPSTTTAEQDINTESQRHINRVWEYTQAAIAITVVVANIIVQVATVFMGLKSPVPESLSNVLFLVVGFYFSRTNHTAIGGVGPKKDYPYTGR